MLGGLGARGRLGEALGRVRNGLGTPSWAGAAAKFAILTAELVLQGAKLAVSTSRWALLGRFQALVERVDLGRRLYIVRGGADAERKVEVAFGAVRV